HESVPSVLAGSGGLVVDDHAHFAFVADEFGHVLGGFGGSLLVVRGRRGQRDVGVHAGVEGDDRDALAVGLLQQSLRRTRVQCSETDRIGLAGDRVAQHGDLVLDVALGGRPLERHLRAHLLPLLFGAVLDRLPELLLEPFGADGDVGLIAITAAFSAATVFVGAAGQSDGHGRGGRAEQNFTSTHCCSPSVSALCDECGGGCAAGSVRGRWILHWGRAGESDGAAARSVGRNQVLERLRIESMKTAIRITAPSTTFCHSWGTAISCSPLLITEMIRAPMRVPRMEPFPPIREVPPITTAAIACSS